MIRMHSDSEVDKLRPDLTPLLDIIFIVLVFLLLTANVPIDTLELAIPKTEQGETLKATEQTALVVGVLDDPIQPWALDQNHYADWGEFSHALLLSQQANPDQKLLIAADKNASIDGLLKVLALLKQHNITTTNIIMESE